MSTRGGNEPNRTQRRARQALLGEVLTFLGVGLVLVMVLIFAAQKLRREQVHDNWRHFAEVELSRLSAQVQKFRGCLEYSDPDKKWQCNRQVRTHASHEAELLAFAIQRSTEDPEETTPCQPGKPQNSLISGREGESDAQRLGRQWAHHALQAQIGTLDSGSQNWFAKHKRTERPLDCLRDKRGEAFPGPSEFISWKFWERRVDDYWDDFLTAETFPQALADEQEARTNTRQLLGQAFTKDSLRVIWISVLVVISCVLGLMPLLYLLALLRLSSNRAHWWALGLLSLPAFAAASWAMTAVGYSGDDPTWSDWQVFLLVVVVAVVAGGVTFDVGRRVLMLVEQEKDAPPIRGLEHFGRRKSLKSLVTVPVVLFHHIWLTIVDLLRGRGGLDSAKGLEHFILRSVEFRALEYLASRGAFIVDNILVIGFLIPLEGLVSHGLAVAICDTSALGSCQLMPEQLVEKLTAIITVSVILRVIMSLVHYRLFPGKMSR